MHLKELPVSLSSHKNQLSNIYRLAMNAKSAGSFRTDKRNCKTIRKMLVARFSRNFSTNSLKLSATRNALGGRNLVEAVAVTTNGKTIVAWHPEPEFPYEFTRPLPVASEKQSSSLIKEEALASAMSAFKDKKPEVARAELMRLTHTTKHRWFPRSRDKRAKSTPMDRPYL